MPVDFIFTADANERAAARSNLDTRFRIAPGRDALHKLKAAGIPETDGLIVLRLVRC